MAIQDPDTHGYYLVGFKKFYNKTEALIYSTETEFTVRWVFNDEVYKSYNWQNKIDKSITQLYTERAKQLREKYDYLVLHYSGGQDSNNILHSFIDNDLIIDEIIIQVPEPQRKFSIEDKTDFSNYWAEIDFQAIPYLKKHINKLSKTKITIQDMSQTPIELLHKDNWMEIMMPGASYNIGVLSRAMGNYTTAGMKLTDSNKTVCQILGIDKPLVYYNELDDSYHAFFSDQTAYHIPPLDKNLKDVYKHNVTEWFYWTPDMPEIVIKQSQLIKEACENDSNIKELFKKTYKDEVGIFRGVMQNIIYNIDHIPKFQTKKPPMNAGEVLNSWFFQGDDKEILRNYNYALNFLDQNISGKYFINNQIKNGYTSINTRTYKL